MGAGRKVRELAVPAPRVPAADSEGDKRPTKRPWAPPKVHTMDIWGTKTSAVHASPVPSRRVWLSNPNVLRRLSTPDREAPPATTSRVLCAAVGARLPHPSSTVPGAT